MLALRSTTLLLCLGLATSALASAQTPPVNPLFTPLLATLEAQVTQVPVRLPYELLNADTTTTLYALIGSASSASYTVTITTDPACSAHACRYGDISGSLDTSPVDTSTALIVDTVTLADGSSALAISPKCFASCLSPYLVWNEGQYRYYLSMDVANFPQDLVSMANSMNIYGGLGSAAKQVRKH
jgi:hypothetical protein